VTSLCPSAPAFDVVFSDCTHRAAAKERPVKTAQLLFLYRSPTDAPRQAPSPAEMQEAIAHWNAWKAKFQDEIVDMGDALTPVVAVCRPSVVTDRPFIEGKEIIGGYMLVATESLERAVQIAGEGPMAKHAGGSVEIRALAGRSQKTSSS
jgi:hypothetical protein